MSDWEKLGLPAPRAQLLRIRYENRLPSALENLTGPTHGIVQLPPHVAWSGRTAFDIDQPKQCISMYQIVLTEGQRDDVTAYIDHGLLVTHWPILHRLLGRIIRDAWESKFPQLSDSQYPEEFSHLYDEFFTCRKKSSGYLPGIAAGVTPATEEAPGSVAGCTGCTSLPS